MRQRRNGTRRLVVLAAVTVAVTVGVTGCSDLPDGIDGDLTGGWGDFGEPVEFVPAAGTCHADPYRPTAPLIEYAPVDCDEPHLVETVHVGEFADDAADLAEPPEIGSDELREAYAECEEQAEEFLGADFRFGRLWLGVATPSVAGWEGGGRWFRCDLLEVESVYGDVVERQGTLAGALAADGAGDGNDGNGDGNGDGATSSLRLGCFTVEVDDGEVESMSPVGCDQTHEAEFVGIWRAPDGPYLDFSNDNAETRVYDGCREQVADYVDVPVDGDLVYRTGTIADWMSELDWDAGDQAFRCYLWLPDRELTESLAGAGEDELPVRTE